MKLAWIALLTLTLCANSTIAADSPRQRQLIDDNWHFTLGDPSDAGKTFVFPEPGRLDKTSQRDVQQAKIAATRPSAAETNLGSNISYVAPDFDDHAWRSLDLPHDWVVELPFNSDGNESHGFKDIDSAKGTDIGWYRKNLDIPSTDQGKTLTLEFDGIYRNSLVWLNGHCLGRNRSGYTSFQYDITKFVNFTGKNTLVVRVDVNRTEGWFYEGGGIYRHVWLTKTNPLHVAHWGTFVTSEVTGPDATVTVQTQLQNDQLATEIAIRATVTSTILDADGKTVAQSDPTPTDAKPNQTLTQKIPVPAPHLWSPEKPYMYKLVTTIKQADTIADIYETPFGIRTIHFDVDKGLFLNGVHVEIKGVCNHQDFAGVGVAVPDSIEDFRVRKLKEMGANAWRMSHNPPNPELLNSCDRQGMLVMDENRRMDDTPDTLDQLRSMILRDRNHPSIFLWSIGNEENGIQGTTYGATIATTMQNAVHELDPTRFCTVAMNARWGLGFSNVIDVQGFNYLKQGDMDAFHAKFPTKPTIATEEASTLTDRGMYYDDPPTGYVSAYDQRVPGWGATAEGWWTYYQKRPFVAGGFAWTGFDYRGEPNPYSWPCISTHFGIMDTCGFPKDIYYYYQAWWSKTPVLHLLPHWNWPAAGAPIDVVCYSNYPVVELFLNGKSLGREPIPMNSHADWRVKYTPGTLEARAYSGGRGRVVAATTRIETTTAPAKISLTADRTTLTPDGRDATVIAVSIRDDHDRIVPTASNMVKFDITNANIIGVGNGDPSCHEPDKATQRSAFNGLLAAVIQSTKTPGDIELTATAPGLTPATLTLHSTPTTLPKTQQ